MLCTGKASAISLFYAMLLTRVRDFRLSQCEPLEPFYRFIPRMLLRGPSYLHTIVIAATVSISWVMTLILKSNLPPIYCGLSRMRRGQMNCHLWIYTTCPLGPVNS